MGQLPNLALKAIECDWSRFADCLMTKTQLLVLGRGPGFAIAHEVALKFKEVCQIRAEAYSAAEVLHGPMSIVSDGFPVLVLITPDKAKASTAETAARLKQHGAETFVTSTDHAADGNLPIVGSGYPLLDPILLAITFYAFVETLARMRALIRTIRPT